MAIANEGILEKVRKLLVLAQNEAATADEREAFEAKANKLMARYAIDQAILESLMTKEEKERPVAREFKLFDITGYRWNNHYDMIIRALERLCRVKTVNLQSREIGLWFVAGYSVDVEYFEMLWTTIHLSWVSALNPKWNKTAEADDDENVYRFVTAGYKWKEIAEAGGYDWPDGGKLKRAYNRYCKAHGITPASHTQRHDAYKLAFADAFQDRIRTRISRMVIENEDSAQATVGAEVALLDRHADVVEAVYEVYPYMRPKTKEEMEKIQQDYDERQAEANRLLREKLAAMTDKQREAFFDKEERRQERDARSADRYWERQAQRRSDSRGSQAGTKAADSVDLRAGSGTLGGAERKGLS